MDARCSSAPTNAEGLHTQLNNCQAITSLMSLQAGRPVHQPTHFHGNTSPQPPPVKKMAPMASHYPAAEPALRCFNTPIVAANMKPAVMPANACSATNRVPSLALLAPTQPTHEFRMKIEHDNRLAGSITNIAPPTPPATPAGGTTN